MTPLNNSAQALTQTTAKTTGRLYGIGVGPGDPELITVKALRILQSCPVLAYQSASDRPSTARQIVAQYLSGTQAEICYHLPRALDPVAAASTYDAVIEPIDAALAGGQDVVVLCEGDPLFYGSFMYLYTRLGDRYTTEIIPGVSSPMGCASVLKTPLSYRNDVFSVLSATLPEKKLKFQLQHVDAAAIIKLRRNFSKVRQILKDLDLIDRVQYIEGGTMPNQRIVPIEDVDPDNVPYFAMILLPTQSRF
ncbi:MAG: precorrin-2 C(20)-methyltransferase [Alkalinema sp. RU_4_3]|nr:precorrin-2 C(20)-methyltransferase [Alkalinema sp. RU_4_3]